MSVLWNLFTTFFKIGLFTFGGGYAMIPLLSAELAKKKRWTTDEELMDYYSIGQCTPGIIAVNVSTFIGYKLKGVSGAVAATAGMVAPSVVIIIAIANAVSFYMKNEYVAHAFAGIRIVVIALIFDVVLGMWKKGVGSWFQGIIFCLSLLALAWLSVSPVTVVLAAAVIGRYFVDLTFWYLNEVTLNAVEFHSKIRNARPFFFTGFVVN